MEQTFDVIVVGSGASGLTAAVVAAQADLKVLVLESTACFGGTTAYSGGVAWLPGHHLAPSCTDDSRTEAEAYLKSLLGTLYDESNIDAFLTHAPEMLRYLERNTQVRMVGFSLPDYYPDLPGSKENRSVMTMSYDGKNLGPYLPQLRPHIPEMGLFHSMQLGGPDMDAMQNWYRSLSNFKHTLGFMAGYIKDRLIYGRGRYLANGNALAGRLLKSAIDANVTLWNNTPAVRLVEEGGRISGVVCEKDGNELEVSARKGVILASGGYGANREMVLQSLRKADANFSLQPEGCKGDGINMGLAMGASLNNGNEADFIWTPVSTARRDDGSLAMYPSLFGDRHRPGSLMIDAATAKRFTNESLHYQDFGQRVKQQGIEKIWIISDSRAVAKHGLGLVKPKPFSVKPWVRKGYVVEAQTINDLAVRIGVDSVELEKTVAQFNGYADAGIDPDFARGDDKYSAFMGDANHKPNPTLGALRRAPYYALPVHLGSLCTVRGLDANAHTQVTDEDGKAIPGLYAVGVDNNTIWRGHYPGGGASIAPAMTHGYIAARHLASE